MSGAYNKLYIFVLIVCIIEVKCYYFNNKIPDSPCPAVFSYRWQPIENRVIGRIVIPNPPRIFQQLTLLVFYEIRETLVDNNRAKISLRWTRKETMRKILRGEPIIYLVHFPVLQFIPTIVLITLNDVRYCVGTPDLRAMKRKLRHTLYPPLVDPTYTVKDNYPHFQSPDNSITVAPSTEAPIEFRELMEGFFGKQSKKLLELCGRPVLDANFKFQDNTRLYPGQWPWLAAIYITRDPFEFYCTGTLISNRHILTVAHCIYYKNRQLTPNLFVVSLGRYRVDDWNESSATNYEVSQIHVHPHYEFGKTSEADLAVFELSERVRFNWNVRHLCIWMSGDQGFGPVDQLGYVAGWGDKTPAGKIENGTEDAIVNENSVAKLHVIPIITPEKCRNMSKNLRDFITENTFCAGSQNGASGPCNGDSGAAIAVYNSVQQTFHLRGIVSLSAVDKKTLECDYKDLILYVDVAKYSYWILSKIFQN